MKICIGRSYKSRSYGKFKITKSDTVSNGRDPGTQEIFFGVSLEDKLPQWFFGTGKWFVSDIPSELDLMEDCNDLAKSERVVERKEKNVKSEARA